MKGGASIHITEVRMLTLKDNLDGVTLNGENVDPNTIIADNLSSITFDMKKIQRNLMLQILCLNKEM